ncbi:hypothetical protein [Litchfieldella xinjiangensis]|uniref:hypothetical protein n=1 Tax=Litchfieldella xinjiangensis TaxID=1166948 RepID=UPI0005BB04CD|nr:hypothetical protein [Halomonas xinjiangensis]
MPTINLGRVRFNWRGQYDPLVAYVEYDCVEDDGQSYVCIAPVTGTGPNDTEGGTYWGSMLIRSADYNQARQDAIDAAAAASESATSAGGHATTAGNAATASGDARDMAQQWANEAEDVEVSPGLYSAYHYAQKAAAFGDPNQFDITAYQTTDTRNLDAWAAQVLLNQQKGADNETAIGERAKLTGGADANFAAMPQVGGAPIVESDSNSDGDWVRWADGTMQVTSRTAVAGNGVNYLRYSVIFAAVFSKPPRIMLTGAADASLLESNWSFNYRSLSLTGVDVVRTMNNSFNGTYDIDLFATGLWK